MKSSSLKDLDPALFKSLRHELKRISQKNTWTEHEHTLVFSVAHRGLDFLEGFIRGTQSELKKKRKLKLV